MDMLSSLNVLNGKSSNLLKDSFNETRSSGVKWPLSNFTTWSYDDILSQCIVVSLVESIRQVHGAISFHIGQWGMPTERPKIDKRRADIVKTNNIRSL